MNKRFTFEKVAAAPSSYLCFQLQVLIAKQKWRSDELKEPML